jgi:dGTPase
MTEHNHPTTPGDGLVVPAGALGSKVVLASLTAYGRDHGGIRLAHRDSHAQVAPGPFAVPGREAREAALDVLLAPFATRSHGAGDRVVEELPDVHRTCFERDLDRIKYSRPFRRLAGKCQVFLAPDDAHLRNRLTHAIEVAQVALGVASAVGLNTALVEAIALGHDCGHGPGGHASEDAFSEYLPNGYDHAVYGAEVVLAELNLCRETYDGIRNHSWRLPAPMTPEGEVVSWADRIAYVCHDADDAIRSGIITAAELPEIVRELCGTRQSAQVRAFVNGMVSAIEQTGQVGMTGELADALDAFRKFNYERIYQRPASNRQNERVVAMLRGLVEHYADAPGRIPAVRGGEWAFAESGSPEAFAHAVRYVSGMTDRYAIGQAADLLGWGSDALPRGV